MGSSCTCHSELDEKKYRLRSKAEALPTLQKNEKRRSSLGSKASADESSLSLSLILAKGTSIPIDVTQSSTWDEAVALLSRVCDVDPIGTIVAVGFINTKKQPKRLSIWGDRMLLTPVIPEESEPDIHNKDIYDLWERTFEGRKALENLFVYFSFEDDTVSSKIAASLLSTVFDSNRAQSICEAFTDGRGGARINFSEIALLYSVLCFDKKKHTYHRSGSIPNRISVSTMG